MSMLLLVVFQSAPANDESNYQSRNLERSHSKSGFNLFKLSIRQKFVAEEFKNLATL